MKKDWWFFKDGFKDWLLDEFPDVFNYKAMPFVNDLIDNVIEYGLKVTETPKDFIEMMVNIIPEVTYKEWEEWINR